MYNKYSVNIHDNINDLYSTLDEIGFTNEIDGDSSHYYWRADTPKKFYLSIEDVGNNFAEIFVNVITDGGTEKFKVQPFLFKFTYNWGIQDGVDNLMISTIPLYGGGLVFGIRAYHEYQNGYDGNFIDMHTVMPPAKWFAIVPPENRNEEWVYVIFDQAYKYDETEGEYVSIGYDKMYGSAAGLLNVRYQAIRMNALNCTALTNFYTTTNNINTVYKNLWTYGLDYGDNYIHRLFTVKNKKYILLNDCNYDISTSNYSILCRYS